MRRHPGAVSSNTVDLGRFRLHGSAALCGGRRRERACARFLIHVGQVERFSVLIWSQTKRRPLLYNHTAAFVEISPLYSITTEQGSEFGR